MDKIYKGIVSFVVGSDYICVYTLNPINISAEWQTIMDTDTFGDHLAYFFHLVDIGLDKVGIMDRMKELHDNVLLLNVQN